MLDAPAAHCGSFPCTPIKIGLFPVLCSPGPRSGQDPGGVLDRLGGLQSRAGASLKRPQPVPQDFGCRNCEKGRRKPWWLARPFEHFVRQNPTAEPLVSYVTLAEASGCFSYWSSNSQSDSPAAAALHEYSRQQLQNHQRRRAQQHGRSAFVHFPSLPLGRHSFCPARLAQQKDDAQADARQHGGYLRYGSRAVVGDAEHPRTEKAEKELRPEQPAPPEHRLCLLGLDILCQLTPRLRFGRKTGIPGDQDSGRICTGRSRWPPTARLSEPGAEHQNSIHRE